MLSDYEVGARLIHNAADEIATLLDETNHNGAWRSRFESAILEGTRGYGELRRAKKQRVREERRAVVNARRVEPVEGLDVEAESDEEIRADALAITGSALKRLSAIQKIVSETFGREAPFGSPARLAWQEAMRQALVDD